MELGHAAFCLQGVLLLQDQAFSGFPSVVGYLLKFPKRLLFWASDVGLVGYFLSIMSNWDFKKHLFQTHLPGTNSHKCRFLQSCGRPHFHVVWLLVFHCADGSLISCILFTVLFVQTRMLGSIVSHLTSPTAECEACKFGEGWKQFLTRIWQVLKMTRHIQKKGKVKVKKKIEVKKIWVKKNLPRNRIMGVGWSMDGRTDRHTSSVRPWVEWTKKPAWITQEWLYQKQFTFRSYTYVKLRTKSTCCRGQLTTCSLLHAQVITVVLLHLCSVNWFCASIDSEVSLCTFVGNFSKPKTSWLVQDFKEGI